MGNARPFRIGYVLARFPSVTETFIANEIRGLMDCGATVTVFALREGPGEVAAQCPVFYRGGGDGGRYSAGWGPIPSAAREAVRLEFPYPSGMLPALRNVPAACEFALLADQCGIEHLHAHFNHIPADVALMMGRLNGLSVSFSAHAWDVYCRGHTFPAKIARAGLCIACTDAARRHLVSLARQDDRGKVQRIYHGTDLDAFPFQPPGEAREPARILAVGRLVPKKGFETLLYACRRLRERMLLTCEIIGDGPLQLDLKNLARQLGLDEAVCFTGGVPYKAMPDAYRRSDVLAMPSVIAPDGDRDGLPNVVTEAMASGLPVVGSRLGGIPEAVEDARTGLLFPPGNDAALADALHLMLTDAALRAECAGAARAVVEDRFDASKNTAQVLAALKSAAGRDAAG